MNRRRSPHKILVYEAVGFLAILALVWLDDVFGIPEKYLGDTGHPEWRELTVETVAILAIALVLILMTRRLVSRLFYLENFLKVCAWCRRIQHEGEWSSLEEYFSSGFDTRTTHGMCPECFEKTKPESPRRRRKRRER
jgi:hypothetical protein